MPKSTAVIVRAKRKVNNKSVPAYRVKYFGKNAELLANSEVLNTRKNASKNIDAMRKLVNEDMDIEDTTADHKSWPE